MSATRNAIKEAARDFIRFVNKGPSPYHVVDECKRTLVAGGYHELSEKESWILVPEGKYFVISNFSTIIAFAVGGQYKAGNGFSIIGAHTDSPCLRVKPRSARLSCGYVGVGVQLYGGGIWHTWFDRDLKLAGRVVCKSSEGLVHRLVHIEEPILRVPNICIHLARDMNTAFSPNKELHTGVSVLATCAQAELENTVQQDASGDTAHPPLLLSLLSEKLQCTPSEILEFELCLADAQPAVLGGAFEEFIFAPRIDNLMNCYTGMQGLLGADDSLPNDTNVRMLALFDNEEVGSESAQGAMSAIVEWTLRRICAAFQDSPVSFEEAIPKSLLVSADQAHAVHPNYPEKHEQNHQPKLHKGVVLKYNCNQRYATTAITAAILKEVARLSDVPIQEVAVRNDSGCGSTIGPLMSAKLGMRTVDVGTPQLSMHSIREMSCTTGVSQASRLYKQFYESFPSIDSSFTSK